MPLIWIIALTAVFAIAGMLLLVGVLTLDVLSLALAALLFWLGLRLRTQAQARTSTGAEDPHGQATLGSEPERSATASTEPTDGVSAAPTDSDTVADNPDPHPDAELEPDGDSEDGLVLAPGEATTSVSDDGVTLHGSGHGLRRHATGEPIDPDRLAWDRDGARTVRVASAAGDLDELQADGLDPGQPVALVPQRVAGQATRVRVFDDTIDHLAGWLPDEDAEQLAPLLLRGAGLRAMALYEWRDADGQRRELSVLVYRPDVLADA